MNKLVVGNTEVVAIFSAFEKLIVLTGYKMTKHDIQLLEKVIHLLDAQKLPLVRAVYGAVFIQLDNADTSEDSGFTREQIRKLNNGE